MFCFIALIQAATRSSAVSDSVTFSSTYEGCAFLFFTKKCRALSSLDFLKGLDCLLIMFCLNELIQAAIRSSVVSKLVILFLTDKGCSFLFITKKCRALSSLIFLDGCRLISDHDLFCRGHTRCNPALSCEQFDDYLTTAMLTKL